MATFSGLTLNAIANGYSLQATSAGLTAATTPTFNVVPQSATQLVVTSVPTFVAPGGTFSVTVQAESAAGVVDPTYNGNVTLAIPTTTGNNVGGAVLGVTLTKAAVNGVATFTGLTLSKATTTTLTATGPPNLTGPSSATITVETVADTQLSVPALTPNLVVVSSSFIVKVQVENSTGATDPTSSATVTLSLTNNPTLATLTGTLTAAAVAGVATFSGLSLNKIGSGYTLQATSGSLTAGATTFSVTAGTATKLAVSTPPPGTMVAGAPFPLTVLAEDANGNVDTTFGTTAAPGTATLTLATSPGSGASLLQAGAAVSAVSGTIVGGVAVFPNNVSLNLVGAYTLKVTATAASHTAPPAITTTSITVNPAAAVNLTVTTAQQPPPSVTPTGSFGFGVTALDQFGNIATGYNGVVTATIANNPGGGTLSGTQTATAAAGVATFTGLTVNKAAIGYTFTASGASTATSASLAPATTSAVKVNAAAATKLVVSSQPPGSVTAGFGFGFVVTAQDANGNVDTTFTGNLTVVLAANPGAATLGGTLPVSASGGVATFSGLTLNNAASGYTLSVSGSLPTVTTGTFTVLPQAVTQLVITSLPLSRVALNSPFNLTVVAEDALGNVVPSFTGPVTLTGGTATLGGTLTPTIVNGVATFTGATITTAGTGLTIVPASPNLTSATASGISASAAVAMLLQLSTPPPGVVAAGSPFSLTFQAVTSAGVLDTSFTGPVTLSVANNPGLSETLGVTGGSLLTVNAAGGIATFSGLTLNAVTAGTTLQATSNGVATGTTGTIVVTPGAAAQLKVTAPLASVPAGTPLGTVTVQVLDAFGNLVTTFSGNITLTLAVNPTSGATLGGKLTVAAINGVATFTGLSVNKAGTGYNIEASAALGGLAVAVSNPTSSFNITGTQLVFTTQPTASVLPGATLGSVVVKAEDPTGTVDPNFTGVVTLTLNPLTAGGATLGGTLTATASAGSATFSNLTLNRIGSGYTIQATTASSVLTTAVSTAIAVTAPASKLVVIAQPPATVSAGNAIGLTVAAEDALGNVDTTFNGNVTLSLSANPGGATFGGNLTVAAVNGVASFNGLTVNKAASGYLITSLAVGGVAAVTSTAFNVTATAVTHLVVTSSPPSNPSAGTPFGLAVVAEDAFGNVVTSFSGNVTVGLGNNPNGATLSGTATVAATNGLAVFSGLSLNKAGNGYTLQAFSAGSGLIAATTPAINVTPSTATQLVVTTQAPASVPAGGGFSVVVSAEDGSGNVATSFTGNVTLALVANPGSSTLGGTLSVTALNGVATFNNLTLNKIGTGYTLQATGVNASTNLTSLTSPAFNVTAAAATQLVVATVSPATAGTAFGPVVVTAEDASGNVAPTFNGTVNLALGTNPGGSTLSSANGLSATAVNGVATFPSGLILTKVGTGYTLVASSGSLSATTGAFNVSPPATATQLVVTTAPPSTVATGNGFIVAVTAEDANGNTVTSMSGNATVAILTGPTGAMLTPVASLSATFSGGIATFTGLMVNLAGNYTLKFSNSVNSLTATTGAFTGASPTSTATKFAVTTAVPSSVTAGAPFTFAVTAQNSGSTTASSFNGPVTVAIGGNPGGSTLGGSLTVNAINGVATFTGLTLNKSSSSSTYTLTAASNGLTPLTTPTFAVAAAAAAQVVFTTPPPSSITAGTSATNNPFTLSASIEDAFGNVVSSTATVTLSLLNNPVGTTATLGGTLTKAATAGVASFTGLFLNKAASGYTIQAAGTGLTNAVTGPLTVSAAKATVLAIGTQPPTPNTAGTPFRMVVLADDAAGNVDPTFNGPVTLALGTIPTGSTGVLSAGVSSLTLTGGGTGYATAPTVTFTAPQVAGGITATATAILTAGVVTGLVLNNPGSGYTSAPTISFSSGAAAASASIGTTVTAVSGVATFPDDLMVNVAAATGYTIKATSGTLTAGTSSSFIINAAAASQLKVTTAPTGSFGAGAPLTNVTVQVLDPFGNLVPTASYSTPVVLTLVNNPGGATPLPPAASLTGTQTVAPVNGVATFSGLSVNLVGPSYTLEAQSGLLTPATSTTNFAVTPQAATTLVATVPQSLTLAGDTVTAGVGFNINVSALDSFGNVSTSAGPISLSLATGPAGVTFNSVPGTLANGVATFTVVLNTAGSNYTFKVSGTGTSAGLIAATTTPLVVAAAAATKLVVTSQPQANVPAGTPVLVTVAAEDANGNIDPTFSGTATAAIGTNPGTAALSGQTTAPFVAGVASFSGPFLNKPGTGYTLTFTSTPTLTATTATTPAFSVVAAAPTKLVSSTTLPTTAGAAIGGAGGVVIQVQDANSNVVTNFSGNMTIALGGTTAGAVLGGTLTVPVVNGVATFTGLTLNKAFASYTLVATVSSVPSLTLTTGTFAITPGAAAQVVVTTPPAPSIATSAAFGLIATIEDAFGNVASSTASVGLSILSGPTGGTLGGTANAAAAAGVATFSGLNLSPAGTYILGVTSTGLTSTATAPIVVSATGATKLTVTTPTTPMVAGTPFTVTVTAQSSTSTTDTNFNGDVTLTATGPGALSGTTTVQAVAGVATFTGLTLDTSSATTYTLTASTLGTTPLSAATGAITVNPATATQLSVTTQPTSPQVAGTAFGLTVTALDQFGNTASSFTGTVTLSLTGGLNPGNATIGGATAAAVAGVATFTGVTLNRPGTGYTLNASSGTLNVAQTSAITVNTGTASKLVVTGQPLSSVSAGSSIGGVGGVVVVAEDSSGNVATGFTGTVTLTSTPTLTLTGASTAAAVAGVATFTTVSLGQFGTGDTLTAAATGLTSATTSAFNVTASKLVVTTSPVSPVTAGTTFGPVVVMAEDVSGNTDTNYTGNVTIALTTNPAGTGTLGGTLTVAAVKGVATFPAQSLSLNTPASGYVITATSGSLTAGVSTAFNVNAAAAKQLVVTTQPPATVAAGTPVGGAVGIVVQSEDPFGNVVAPSGTPPPTVTLAVASGPSGGKITGTTMQSLSSGVATFVGLTFNIAGSYTLQATTNVAGVTLPAISPIAVTAAPATQLVVLTTAEPPSSVALGGGFGLTVVAEDANGNQDLTFNGPVTVALAANPGAATLGGTLTVTASAGQAIFSGLTLNKSGAGYSLQVSSPTLTPATTTTINVGATQLVVTAQPPASVASGKRVRPGRHGRGGRGQRGH